MNPSKSGMPDQPQIRITPDDDTARKKAMGRLSTETRAAVESAGLVLVPDDGFRDHTGPVFPQRTMEFLQYLRENAPTGTKVEIAVEDSDYNEVAVHADLVRIATVFVEYVAAPIAMSLIAAYLKDWLGSRHSNAEVRATIVVNRKDGTTEHAVQINYEGPATTFEATIAQAISGRTDPKSSGTPEIAAPQDQHHPPKQLGTSGTKKRTRRK
jgi:hypothetical protein